MADDALWTTADLARFLGYKESTVARMVNAEPHKLPPRVAALFKPRWVPEVCRRWVLDSSVAMGQPRKRGRPRQHVGAVAPLRKD